MVNIFTGYIYNIYIRVKVFYTTLWRNMNTSKQYFNFFSLQSNACLNALILACDIKMLEEIVSLLNPGKGRPYSPEIKSRLGKHFC